jgi:hypothetical protein
MPESLEPVPPGSEIVLTDTLEPGVIAFRPDAFVFADPDDWVIIDFVIGNRSQFNRRRDVIARDFVTRLIDGRCDTVQTRMTYRMKVIPQKPNLRFRCELTGDVA